jgi:hypothetical protein
MYNAQPLIYTPANAGTSSPRMHTFLYPDYKGFENFCVLMLMA